MPKLSVKIFSLFLIWRLGLFLVAFLAGFAIVQFGNRFPYWLDLLVPSGLPAWIWGFANFDGVHYIGIASHGYLAQYSQVFFPLYPLLTGVLSSPFLAIPYINSKEVYLLSGLILSNSLFLLALFYLYKLFRFDYSEKISFQSLILLLAFPTAFYFGSFYSESLFLLLVVLSLLFARKKQYLLAGIFAAIASATRVTGILLWPVLLIELYQDLRDKELRVKTAAFFKALTGLILTPLGLVLYMFFLKFQYNNPLYFLTAQPAFGAQRSAEPFVLLPQVLFRYAKMMVSVPVASLQYLNVILELSFTLIPLALLVLLYKRIRLSYLFFMTACLLVPTLTGTLSSMPRYALMGFLLLPVVAQVSQKHFKLLIGILILLQIILVSLFVRGYWVA